MALDLIAEFEGVIAALRTAVVSPLPSTGT
jgi:hypothetical protein